MVGPRTFGPNEGQNQDVSDRNEGAMAPTAKRILRDTINCLIKNLLCCILPTAPQPNLAFLILKLLDFLP